MRQLGLPFTKRRTDAARELDVIDNSLWFDCVRPCVYRDVSCGSQLTKNAHKRLVDDRALS
jgi:hypothetical protein